MTNPVAIINLWPIVQECWVCGETLVDGNLGIPIYEDEVLPNNHQGEWGGVPACWACFHIQERLCEPMPRHTMRRIRGLGDD